ncbi:MAG: DUF1214 domain-containing protein [Cucumibacter sp.]
MRFVSGLILGIFVALLVGFGASFYALEDGRLFGALRIGPWAAWPGAGTDNVDPYTRAFLARSGQLQLGRSEGMRFIASTDSGGTPLRRQCRYQIDGTTPVATMWTLYARAPDSAVIGVPDRRPFIDSVTIPRHPDGRLTIRAGPGAVPGSWLATPGDGEYMLVLSIYDTSVFAGLGATLDALPVIYPEGCQ